MKHLVILFFLVCLVSSFCSAQSPDDLKGHRVTPVKTINIAVTFITNDTCYLRINEVDYGQIINNKTINLPLGTYKLVFESLETGKTIKDRSFQLIKDSLKAGPIRYLATFK